MNHIRRNTWMAVLVCALVSAGCGDDSTTTIGPSPTTTVDIGGTWSGSASLTMVDGGGCVGISLAAGIGGDDIPIEAVFEQIGTSLVITTTNRTNQERCIYSGTITGDSLTAFVVELHSRSACAWPGVRVRGRFARVDERDALGGVLRKGRWRRADRHRFRDRQSRERRRIARRDHSRRSDVDSLTVRRESHHLAVDQQHAHRNHERARATP